MRHSLLITEPCFLNTSCNCRSMSDRTRLRTLPSENTSKLCQDLTAITRNDKLSTLAILPGGRNTTTKKPSLSPSLKINVKRRNQTLLSSNIYRRSDNFLPKLSVKILLHCFSIFLVNVKVQMNPPFLCRQKMKCLV